jgi:XTP/dITP diphosphohydrolase
MIELQSDTLEDVAKFKIQSILDKVQGNLFIEDAGLFIESLHGFPGVYSAYVNKSIGNPGILKLMDKISNRAAKFVCIVAARLTKNNDILLFKGEVSGTISTEMRGSHGFGYDPIFIPNENPSFTFAELDIQEKNKISHRARAIRKFIEYLKLII